MPHGSDVSRQPQFQAREPVWPLWIAAGGLWACLGFFAFVVPATPARMDRATAELVSRFPLWEALAGIGPVANLTPETLALLLAVFGGGAFLLFAGALRIAWRLEPTSRNILPILCTAVGFFVTVALALPTQNTDVFNYMVQGRVSAVYGQNPYTVAPNAFPDDPVYPYASQQYVGEPNDYLPAWGVYNSTLARLMGDDPVRGLFVYRTGFVVLSIANLLLILGILAHTSRKHLAAGLVTYGWHPIVVLEGPGRIDTLMAFLALVAVFLLVRRRVLAGAFALTLSILTKWITLPLMVCVVAGKAWRREWRTLLGIFAAALLATALVYAPFMDDIGILYDHFRMLMRGGSSAPDTLRWLLGGGLLALTVWLGRYHDGEGGIQIWTWAVILLYFTAFLTKIGYGWYLIVPAAITALVRDARIVVPFLALSLGAFAFQMRDGSFNSRYEVADLIPVDRFWIFVALAGAGVLALIFARHRISGTYAPPG